MSGEKSQRGDDAGSSQLSGVKMPARNNQTMSASENLRNRLSDILPAPRLRPDMTAPARRPVKRIILFGQHPNPTSDYYFSARLAAPGMPEYQVIDIRDSDLQALDADGAFVIFCRYASARALDWVERFAEQLSGVGLFVDDNIPAVIASSESSVRYKFSLFTKALWPLRRLNRHLDIVWVSTPQLARELSEAFPRILPPAPPAALWKRPFPAAAPLDKRLTHIAFHATGIHVEEHRYLQPIMWDILADRPTISFEVFADARTTSLWQGNDRITVRKPLPWRDYVKDGARRQIDIMLVPLTASRINDCRSSTKRVDVARAGAAGVFSISEAYGNPDASGEIRIPNAPRAWRETILDLVDNPTKRFPAAQATREIVQRMTRMAEDGLHFGNLGSKTS